MPLRDLKEDEKVIPFDQPRNVPSEAPTLPASPLPNEGFEERLFRELPVFQIVANFSKESALPTVGAGIGAFGGPLGIAAGSLAGEGLNQAFGITPRSNLQLLLAGGLPMLPAILRRGTAFPRHFATSKRAAITLNKLGPKEANRLVERFAPRQGAKELFEIAARETDRVPMPRTLGSLNSVIQRMEKASTPPTVLKRLQNLREKIIANGNGLNPADMQDELEIVGRQIAKLEREEGSPFGAAKLIFKSMYDDLDNIADDIPAAKILRLARETSKRQRSIDDMADLIEESFTNLRGQGTNKSFNAAKIIRKLEADRFFTQSFNPVERKEIVGLLEKLNKIPSLPPGAGQQFGSGELLSELLGLGKASLLTAGFGSIIGLDPVSSGITGAALYAGKRFVIDPTKTIAFALSLKEGRNLLSSLLREGSLSENAMGILVAWAATQLTDEGEKVKDLPKREPVAGIPGKALLIP